MNQTTEQPKDLERLEIAGRLYLYDATRKTAALRLTGPFRDEAGREAWAERIIREREDKQRAHDARVQAKREAKATLVNPFQVGQILNYSWGYDETHQEYAVIVETSPRSVVLRHVPALTLKDGGAGGDTVAPDTLREISGVGDSWRVTIQVSRDGKPYLPARYWHRWSLWDGRADYETNPCFGH